jgi:GNAT superfamily N-acetyltransferase
LDIQSSHVFENPKIEVRPIETKEEFKQFFNFPWELYKNDENWVPPLVSMRSDLLNRKKNPSWEYMEGQHFGAWIGDKLVGTISAVINHHHNEKWNEKIGWFGTFETINNQEVANALLKQAEDWVKSKGYKTIRGPQSFTTHEETGLLVEGNDEKPVLLMPYNPKYYQTLLENAGYGKSMDLKSVVFDRTNEKNNKEVGARLDKLAEWTKERYNITVRSLDGKNKKEEFKLFKELYNEAWDENWGFTPMTPRELDTLVESLGMFVEPDLAFFAYVDGKPAGFSLTIPDLNQLLHKVQPNPDTPEILSLIKLGWHWKVAPEILNLMQLGGFMKNAKNVVTKLRCPLLGVLPDYRKLGIPAVLLSETYKNTPTNIQQVDFGWLLETNHDIIDIGLRYGADLYKTHRLYERNLGEEEA